MQSSTFFYNGIKVIVYYLVPDFIFDVPEYQMSFDTAKETLDFLDYHAG